VKLLPAIFQKNNSKPNYFSNVDRDGILSLSALFDAWSSCRDSLFDLRSINRYDSSKPVALVCYLLEMFYFGNYCTTL
jgi:hypothetical protein